MRMHEISESQSVPMRTFKTLYHVGTLDASSKQNGSYEGSGLSVSRHPTEWAQIARLTGSVWQCTKPGNQFVNFYKLSKMNKAAMEDWAIRGGWATRRTAWRVSFYDAETEESRYFLVYDKQEAEEEAEEYDTKPRKVNGAVVSTPRLAQRMLQHESGVECLDLIAVAYVEDVMRCDGVWWSERLDVEGLSAPRGVIVPSMVSSWKFTQVR